MLMTSHPRLSHVFRRSCAATATWHTMQWQPGLKFVGGKESKKWLKVAMCSNETTSIVTSSCQKETSQFDFIPQTLHPRKLMAGSRKITLYKIIFQTSARWWFRIFCYYIYIFICFPIWERFLRFPCWSEYLSLMGVFQLFHLWVPNLHFLRLRAGAPWNSVLLSRKPQSHSSVVRCGGLICFD